MADSVRESVAWAPARRPSTTRAALLLAGALTLGVPGLAACGPSSGPAKTPAAAAPAPTSSPHVPDPAVKPYCDAIAKVQAEQAAPQAGTGGVAAGSDAARRQIASLVATAPPEIAGDWQVLDGLTNRALGSLAATHGDPKRIDHKTLDKIAQRAQPTQAHIKDVTQKRCGIAFSAAAGPAPARATTSATTTAPPTTSSSTSSKGHTTTKTAPRTTSPTDG